ILKPNHQLTIQQIQHLNPHFLIISPPPSTPHQAPITIQAIKHFPPNIPIFPLSLPHQSIPQLFRRHGIPTDPLMHPKT
ncbi:glutamine amidotransferase-related protein, partial [Bacillus altitudinis]|uniref:glutamine amidotransferase-related protein n=1 Tax=Bacillus altitudinis TaxID=293387 RepID=UPI003B523E6B